MIRNKFISKKKQALYDDFQKIAYTIGDQIEVKFKYLYPDHWQTSKLETLVDCTIKSIYPDGSFELVPDGSHDKVKTPIKPEQISKKNLWKIGANPFVIDNSDIRAINFSLDSLIGTFNLDGTKYDHSFREAYVIEGVEVLELNWNPFIHDKDGNKHYYQRPFVWTKKDNQLLIESIYNGIECGRILVRHRSWGKITALIKKGETEIGFREIVDGKQRLNAVRGFLNDEFKDFQGNTYSDLSAEAQHHFGNHQLFSYAEMGESCTDEQVITQFLKLNFTGKPQSIEHINHVKSILKKL